MVQLHFNAAFTRKSHPTSCYYRTRSCRSFAPRSGCSAPCFVASTFSPRHVPVRYFPAVWLETFRHLWSALTCPHRRGGITVCRFRSECSLEDCAFPVPTRVGSLEKLKGSSQNVICAYGSSRVEPLGPHPRGARKEDQSSVLRHLAEAHPLLAHHRQNPLRAHPRSRVRTHRRPLRRPHPGSHRQPQPRG